MNVIFVIALLLCPVVCLGQSELSELVDEAAEDRALTDPSIESPAQGNKEGFRITSSNGAKTAAINLSFDDFLLTMEGPVGDADLSKLVSLSGLANSVTLDAGYKYTLWGDRQSRTETRLKKLSTAYKELENYRSTGERSTEEQERVGAFTAFDRTLNEFATEMEADLTGRETVTALRILASNPSCRGILDKEGLLSNEIISRERLCRDNLRTLVKATAQQAEPTFIIGARLKFGLADFDFLVTGGAPESETKANWAPLVFAGYISPQKRVFIGGNYSYEMAHEGGESVSVCKNFPEIPNGQQCQEAQFGPPDLVKSHLTQAELRYYFSNSFAINPRLTYSSEQDVTSFEVPLYFIKNDDEDDPGLTGGVSIGWRSDQDKPALSIFVGAIGIFDWLN